MKVLGPAEEQEVPNRRLLPYDANEDVQRQPSSNNNLFDVIYQRTGLVEHLHQPRRYPGVVRAVDRDENR